MKPAVTAVDPAPAVIAHWRAAWPKALAVWSKYTRLHDARLCNSRVEAASEGLTGSFAMIRLMDQSVVIDLETTGRLGLDDFAVEILAHEIGHHVLAPATATDQFRLLARIRRALPTLERHAPMVANLYTDLFINDRLQRQAGLRMADIYRVLEAASRDAQAQSKKAGGVWMLYMGIYEELWKLGKGSLGGPVGDGFASLLLPYLLEDVQPDLVLSYVHDTQTAAEGCEPSGVQGIEDDEIDGALHPANDARITGIDTPPVDQPARAIHGQTREPFEVGEILRAAGITLSDHDLAIRYYRERALPHLVAFPTRPSTDSPEPQLEGLEPWEIGDALDEVDWLQTVIQSPRLVPGVTTVRRQYGLEAGTARPPTPVDLDMYVDSSGSMPNPQRFTSYLTLAGAIIALSALRAGSGVQVTLWSGKNQEMHTNGFVRDEAAILRILTGFYGGATAFPIHRLRDTFAKRPVSARPVHLLMISDDGITTMFDQDERGGSGWDIAAHALSSGGAGGTMALNLRRSWDGADTKAGYPYALALQRAQREQGWDIHAIERMEDLLAFAHAFSQRHYAATAARAGGART